MAINDELIRELEGMSDDDLSEDTDDIGTDDGEEEVELEDLLADIKGGAEDDEDDDEAPAEEDSAFNKRLTEELNRIIPQRLARDRKTQQVQELESLTGLSLEQIRETVIKNMVADKADELGISEEEAEPIVLEKLENVNHKTQKQMEKEQEQEISAAMQQVNYLKERNDFASKPKFARLLTKEVLAEIDEFTGKGTVLSFADGATYILGKKVVGGDLYDRAQNGALNKARARTSKRVSPQSGGGSSQASGAGLNSVEREMAARLGVSSKEFAVEKSQITKNKQRRGR